MNDIRQELIAMELEEGINKTSVPYLNIYRYKNSPVLMPPTGIPNIYYIVDGSLRLHTPRGIMDYITGQYSVSAIDTPISGQILTLGAKGDFIAVSVDFTFEEVIDVILKIDGNLIEKIMNEERTETTMTEFDKEVGNAIIRLVNMQNNLEKLSYTAKLVRKEIIFNSLCGSCGKQFVQSVTGLRQAGDIYEINSWIKENYRENFTVEDLAERENMSVSSFHLKFKNAVGMGPMQCQKRLRLTEARRQMLDENVSVTEAAIDVGYTSISQFNRDYKKMFLATPTEDLLQLRRWTQK